ncbi:MAG: hypothetical protein K6E51_09850, partial [Treponema sp.]|nr:hypothetical protein [Treponema sp.]
MTDIENLEQIIYDVFGVEKSIKNRRNTNSCISPLNTKPLNLFASHFMKRLERLKKAFTGNYAVLNDIAERVKNIGEAKNAQWAGPYSELVALDFYSQFSEFFSLSYINLLPMKNHRNSIPSQIGHKQVIDIDLCLYLRHDKIFTDIKSFNCIHQNILDEVIDAVEEYALLSFAKSVMIGVDNLSSLDYTEVKAHLGYEKKSIYRSLIRSVSDNKRVLKYESKNGLSFTFRIEYSSSVSTVKEYSPFAMAEAYKYKFLDYGSKLIDNEYSVITMVKNPWFNAETVDFGNFNNMFYRSLARRTFIELNRMNVDAALYSSCYTKGRISVCDVSKSIAGIIFIDDDSSIKADEDNLYSVYMYLNPNYANKEPL